MERETWLQYRNLGIGGSDVGAILGISKYKQPIRVYMEKTNQWTAEDLSDNESVAWGNILEPIIANEFQKRNPLFRVQKCNYILQHPTLKFMLANVDRVLYHPEKGYGILEIKTANERMLSSWEDTKIPYEYALQVQHYLAVSGLEWGYVAVLIGGNKYRQYYVERDQELIDILIQKESDFWINHVEAGDPPMVDLKADNKEIFEQLYPAEVVTDATLDLSGNKITFLVDWIEDCNTKIKELEEKKLMYENDIKTMMAGFERATFGFGNISWKYSKESYSVKADDLKNKYPQIYDELKSPKKRSRIFRIVRNK